MGGDSGGNPRAAVGPDDATVADTRRGDDDSFARMPTRGSTLERYLIVDKIGEGGMGVVYTAYDPYLDRKIAIKLLPAVAIESEDASHARARLVREAQALARVSHPNVVAVHDVGITGDHIFVAMDYVRGKSLGNWLADSPRSMRERLEVFLQAGRGLAAAHAAGIIHRDFKPDNVIVGDDGLVRVVDFGLARAPHESEERERPPDPLALTHAASGRGALSVPLTHAGALMGTPAYMAPEQVRGDRLDERSDQFSFCVALYEALYRERPFSGGRLVDVYDQIVAGRVRPPADKGDVPGWVRRVLLRGLAADPRERYPSMETLLAELELDPARARRRWLAAGTVALLGLGLGAAIVTRPEPEAVCRGAESQLAGVWDDERRNAVRSAFMATRVPYAPEAWSGVETRLDAYGRRWVEMHTDACEATSVRREQSEALLDRRMACLGRRLQELRALSDVFARADAKVVEAAIEATAKLSDIEACADSAALLADVAPPEDSETSEKVDALRASLAHVDVLERAGKIKESLALAREAEEKSRALAYLPVRAEALHWLGKLQGRSGNYAASARTVLEAIALAETAHHDRVAADAWVDFVFISGRQANYEESERHAVIARGVIRRLSDPALEATLDNNLGIVHNLAGRLGEAERHLTRAIEARERLGLGEHPKAAGTHYNLGTVFSAEGKLREAQRQYERSLQIREKALGPRHPSLAYPLLGSGNVAALLGEHDVAEQRMERALRLWEASLGADHVNLAATHHSLGELYWRRRAFDKALEHHTRARAIFEKSLGTDHPDLAHALTGLGQVHVDRGEPKLAQPLLERALELREAHPSERRDLAQTRFALARALVAGRGDRKRARKLAEQARDGYASTSGGWAKEREEIVAWLAAH